MIPERAEFAANEMIIFECENNHKIVVYSSDPYYPDAVECPQCPKLMGRETNTEE